MFNSQDLSLFQTDYFCNFAYKRGLIEVRSKNTGHWWTLARLDMPRSTMVLIKHKYPGDNGYHKQCHVHTFIKAVKVIKEHDDYILNLI